MPSVGEESSCDVLEAVDTSNVRNAGLTTVSIRRFALLPAETSHSRYMLSVWETDNINGHIQNQSAGELSTSREHSALTDLEMVASSSH